MPPRKRSVAICVIYEKYNSPSVYFKSLQSCGDWLDHGQRLSYFKPIGVVKSNPDTIYIYTREEGDANLLLFSTSVVLFTLKVMALSCIPYSWRTQVRLVARLFICCR